MTTNLYAATQDKELRKLQRNLDKLGDLDLINAAADYITLVTAKRDGLPLRSTRHASLLFTIHDLVADYGVSAATYALRAAMQDDTPRGKTAGCPTENVTRLRKLAAEAVRE